MNDTINNLKIDDVDPKGFDNEEYDRKLGCYAFYDKKSERFDTPFYCPSDLFAKRHYFMVVKEPKGIVGNFQEDFNLVRLGYINLHTGHSISDHQVLIEGAIEKEKANYEK